MESIFVNRKYHKQKLVAQPNPMHDSKKTCFAQLQSTAISNRNP